MITAQEARDRQGIKTSVEAILSRIDNAIRDLSYAGASGFTWHYDKSENLDLAMKELESLGFKVSFKEETGLSKTFTISW